MTIYPPMKPGSTVSVQTGPSLEDEIERLVRQHGAESVKEAVKAQTKKKTGPKPRTDWTKLGPVLVQDAIDLIEGRDPRKLRSHRSVAQSYADSNKGQSRDSTFRRVQQELADSRAPMAAELAWGMSLFKYPYQVHLDLLRQFVEKSAPDNFRWSELLDSANRTLEGYRDKIGEIPAQLTMFEVQIQEMKAPPKPMKYEGSNYQGLLGLLFQDAYKAP